MLTALGIILTIFGLYLDVNKNVIIDTIGHILMYLGYVGLGILIASCFEYE